MFINHWPSKASSQVLVERPAFRLCVCLLNGHKLLIWKKLSKFLNFYLFLYDYYLQIIKNFIIVGNRFYFYLIEV